MPSSQDKILETDFPKTLPTPPPAHTSSNVIMVEYTTKLTPLRDLLKSCGLKCGETPLSSPKRSLEEESKQETSDQSKTQPPLKKIRLRLLDVTQELSQPHSFPQRKDLFKQLVNCPLISDLNYLSSELKNQAIFVQAQERYYNKTSTIDDHMAFTLFNQVIEGCYAVNDTLRIQSLYYQALMRYEHRTDQIDDKTAYFIFDQASQSDLLCDFFKLQAQLYMALMHICNSTESCDYALAYKLFDQIAHSGVSLELRLKANLYKAIMRYNGKTNIIDDAQAIHLLLEINNCPRNFIEVLHLAYLFMAKFRYDNRTQEIDDDQAIDFLANIIFYSPIEHSVSLKEEASQLHQLFFKRKAMNLLLDG